MNQLIIDYIQEHLLDNQQEIGPEDDLLNSGIVDSIGLMRLVAFLENHCDIKIPPQDLVIDNFINVNAIETYLKGIQK